MTCVIYELNVMVLFLRILAFQRMYIVSGEGQPVFLPALKAMSWICQLPVRVGFVVDIRDNEPRFTPRTNVLSLSPHP